MRRHWARQGCVWLIGSLLAISSVLAMAAPGWPRLPTDTELQAAASQYAQKYTTRQPGVDMPGSPGSGGFIETRIKPEQIATYHNPKIGDPAQSGEAFLLAKRTTTTVRDSAQREQSDVIILRLVHDGQAFTFSEHVTGWAEWPSGAEIGQFLGAYLNGWYSQTLLDGYSRDDVWLPGFAVGQRLVVIQGHDGSSDTGQMPFSFDISVHESSRPLVNADIQFRFVGERKALADYFAVLDPKVGRWKVSEQMNLALDTWISARTDAQGRLQLRGLLDFGRMRLFNLRLPVEVGIEVQAEGATPAQSLLTLRHPAFVHDVYFWCANDPQWPGAPRWIRLGYLAGPESSSFIEALEPRTIAGMRFPANRYGTGDRPSYPTPSSIPKRILIEGAPFSPPAWDRDYFHPLNEGDEMILDLSQNARFARGGFTPQRGDGLMVEVVWLDGVTALFSQRLEDAYSVVNINGGPRIVRDHRLSGEEDNLLVVTFPASTARLEGTAENTWIRFIADEGAEWLVTEQIVKIAAVGAATYLGGPAAGAWAATICEFGFDAGDALELAKCGFKRHKVVLVRSEVALTQGEGGQKQLYTFRGEPGLIDGGKEQRVPARHRLDFTLDGIVSGPVESAPPMAARVMQATAAAGPGAAPVAVAGSGDLVPPPSTSTSPVEASPNPPPATSRRPPAEADEELAAAQREFDAAFSAYTTLVTTGGEGNVDAALARYRQGYERLKALKRERGIE